jgi:hypothetical protein
VEKQMQIQVNLGDRKRKELAAAVGDILGAEVNYQGPPSYAYEAGSVIIARDGTIVFGEEDAAIADRLSEGLSAQGFEPQLIEDSDPAPDDSPSDQATMPEDVPKEESASEPSSEDGSDGEKAADEVVPGEDAAETPADNASSADSETNTAFIENTPPDEETKDDAAAEAVGGAPDGDGGFQEGDEPEEPDKLVIQLPREGFDAHTLRNLRDLISSKETLIKKAIGADSLESEVTDEAVGFPWFRADTHPQDIAAYTKFIVAMRDLAKRQSRVSSEERAVDDEKLALRLFMVRLDLKGSEYADTRRLMLRSMTDGPSGTIPRERVARPSVPRLELKLELPDFAVGKDEESQSKLTFLRQLGYFLSHFYD